MKALRTKAIVCAAALALSGTAASLPAMPVSAASVQENQTGVYNGMQYEIMGSYCLITGYTDALPEELVIPEQINGYNVEWVHMQAFENCTKLKSVTLPKTIQVLNYACFMGCTSLETVNFPEDMKALRDINSTAFNGTPWLEAQRKKTPLMIFNDILYDGRGSSGDVVIPEGIKTINSDAFRKNTALTSVQFPSTLEKFGSGCFAYCTGLKSVTIPGTVEEIEDDAFLGCTGLETVTMESGVEEIGEGTFEKCTALKTINFPDSLIFLKGPFSHCELLEEIVLPDSVRTINSDSFTCCTNLKSVTIPNYYTQFSDSKRIFTNEGGGWLAKDDDLIYNGVLRGYEGSTTQQYAEEYGIRFESLGAYPTSGSCGGNTAWSLEGDTLTLSGSDPMNAYIYPYKVNGEYSYQGVAPWFVYRDRIKHAVISKDFAGISVGALAFLPALETVTIYNPSLMLSQADTLEGSFFPKCINRGVDEENQKIIEGIRILGYDGSTAQQFAEGWGYDFEALEGDPGVLPVIETVKTGTCGDKLNWKLDTKAKTLEITGTGDMTNFDADDSPAPWFSEGFGGGIRQISIADGVTGIGTAAFAFCGGVEELTLPASVKQIGNWAFELMGELKTLTILNPACVIPDDEYTVCSGIKDNRGYFTGTIRGYAGSTAEAYAKKYGYTFAAIPEGEAVTGDLDGSGDVSISDAQLALQAYTAAFSGLDTGLTEAQLKSADVNGDGTLTVEDAQLILLYYTENSVAMNQVTWAELIESLKN
ncbi:MAG: leucine-rich repeat protein [Oscillospiraceae bacterium]|nr:leucine-rich repeat protein [Oscillospiraceae bacterium]